MVKFHFEREVFFDEKTGLLVPCSFAAGPAGAIGEDASGSSKSASDYNIATIPNVVPAASASEFEGHWTLYMVEFRGLPLKPEVFNLSGELDIQDDWVMATNMTGYDNTFSSSVFQDGCLWFALGSSTVKLSLNDNGMISIGAKSSTDSDESLTLYFSKNSAGSTGNSVSTQEQSSQSSTANVNGDAQNSYSNAQSLLNWSTVFQADTLPDGIRPGTRSGSQLSLSASRDNFNSAGEPVQSAELSFVSGIQENEGLVTLTNDQEGHFILLTDPESAIAAGNTTWHLRMESEHYSWEGDISKEVVPYSSDLGLDKLYTTLTVDAEIGDTINARELISSAVNFPESIYVNAAYFSDEMGSLYSYFSESPSGLSFQNQRGEDTCTVEQNGIYDLYIRTNLSQDSNELAVAIFYPVKIMAVNYTLQGPSYVKPGETAQYSLSDPSVKVDWHVEGEGVSIDENGLLTVREDAESFSSFIVYATPEEISGELSLKGKVIGAGGIFETAEFAETQTTEGFAAGIPTGSNDLGQWETQQPDGYVLPIAFLVSDNMPRCNILYDCIQLNSFYEDPDAAKKFETLDAPQDVENWTGTHIDIDGHPARVGIFTQRSDYDGKVYSCGMIDYVRNNQLYRIKFSASSEYYTVTQEDMLELASYISYDESKASIREDQVTLIVTPEKDATSVSAGQKLKFTATFADPSVVNAKAKNNKVTWYANDNNGQPSADATIDAKGVLTVNKNLNEVKQINVSAVSDSYGTKDFIEITLLPKVTAVNIEPSAVSLFAVEGAEETVTVSLEPASVPLEGLTWTSSPKNVIEIEDHGDGTATIRPLKAGKATVTVKESGGKSGKFTVTVLQPVEALELSTKGKAIPGKSVTVNAKLTPNNATDKTLTWSLDVGEDIATISPKGQVKISKDAPVGTVITVTCTAEGAPEPVIATLELTVVEK